jgi:hypothetical protein
VRANRLSRLGCRGIQELKKGKVRYSKKVFQVIFHLSVGPPPNQPIPNMFDTLGNLADVINRAKFNLDWLRGFGWASTRKSYVSI